MEFAVISKKEDRLNFDGPSIAELLSQFQRNPAYKTLLDLRNKRTVHLYQSFNTDRTTIKLSCLLFDNVTTSELAEQELEYLEGEMDWLEPGDRTAAAPRRQARMMLRKAARFQEETKILRDEKVLIPFQWHDGMACMFQPASISVFGDITYLGTSKMNDLAHESRERHPYIPLSSFLPHSVSVASEKMFLKTSSRMIYQSE